MKSYLDGLVSIKEEIKTLKKHKELLKEFSPEGFYLLDGDHIVIPRQYRIYGDTWRNKIIFNIIASNEWSVPDRYVMILGEIALRDRRNTGRLIPVKIKDLALYVHFKFKTPLFERIIKTGKLPQR
jgi:hypothetical protein